MGIPLIFFDRVIEGQGFTGIVSDDENGSYDLVKFAIDKGYRHIGHLGGFEKTNQQRRQIFQGYFPSQLLNRCESLSQVKESGFLQSVAYLMS